MNMAANDRSDNAPLAFGLVCGAGLSTCIGAIAVYNTALIKLASKKVLGAGLGISAGVMIYVSFIEIFVKSFDEFKTYGEGPGNFPEKHAYAYASLCFFGGVLLMKLVDAFVHFLRSRDVKQMKKEERDKVLNVIVTDVGAARALGGKLEDEDERRTDCTQGPDDTQTKQCPEANEEADDAKEDSSGEEDLLPGLGPCICHTNETTEAMMESVANTDSDQTLEDEQRRKLVRMGLNTAIAIGIHNFPEGLATFIGTMDDPAVGVSLAIAIAIHNIPEGLCVAVPVYYATGNRHKAFAWAFLSGISEPIGAGIGWAILADADTSLAFAIMFGLVAGMMVAIVVHELLPTAHRYDPKDKVVTNTFILGMFVMAVSLVLFQLTS